MLAFGDSLVTPLTEEIWKRFEVKSDEYQRMWFSVFYIEQSDNGFNIYQDPYIARLQPLKSDAKFVLPRQ